ncbi:MAG: 16S rRNA (cytosine(1402)-N(4))-methyltransferase RsmH, partial [Eubacterium sp.]|nr:16S rRNA (cytosine(1402)-N(4))-methyltransferase RsmH [Eubacterium sp.]
MEFSHVPVLLNEVIESLNIRPDGIYVDGTLGGAGHSRRIAERLGEGGRLIGIDRDSDAIEAATENLAPYSDRVTIVRDTYENIPAVLGGLGIDGVDGILLDLGVSSHQLDTAERGFSYMEDGPLDMRMNTEDNLTAEIIVNEYDKKDLARIIRDYGEDRFANNIAAHIVREREKAPIKTTFQLVEIIRGAIPMKIQ